MHRTLDAYMLRSRGWGVLSGISASFLPVWFLRLGGSNLHVGLLSGMPALTSIFVSVPGGRLVERARHPLSVLVVAAALNRLGYLALALAPFFVVADLPTVLVLIVGLLTIISHSRRSSFFLDIGRWTARCCPRRT